jgi:hypothetical protein
MDGEYTILRLTMMCRCGHIMEYGEPSSQIFCANAKCDRYLVHFEYTVDLTGKPLNKA